MGTRSISELSDEDFWKMPQLEFVKHMLKEVEELKLFKQFILYKGYVSQEEFEKFKKTYNKLEKL